VDGRWVYHAQLSRTGVGVEKVGDRNVFLAAIIAAIEFFLSPKLSGSFHSRCCRLAEEPHYSLEVLVSRCQEELLTNKP
jgi:hypothetical protein